MVASALAVLVSTTADASDSIYNLGRTLGYLKSCGQFNGTNYNRGLHQSIRQKYADNKRFKAGFRETDFSGADWVTGLTQCERWAKWLDQYGDRVLARTHNPVNEAELQARRETADRERRVKWLEASSDRRLCIQALNYNDTDWDPRSADAARVAKSRGLSVRSCRDLLEKKEVVATAKTDPAPLPQRKPAAASLIVRRAQTALQTLGLYSGKVDGLYGPRTEAGWRQWLQQAEKPAGSGMTVANVSALEADAASGMRVKPDPVQDAKDRLDTSPELQAASAKCEELGFEPKTPKFGECVLKLMN